MQTTVFEHLRTTSAEARDFPRDVANHSPPLALCQDQVLHLTTTHLAAGGHQRPRNKYQC